MQVAKQILKSVTLLSYRQMAPYFQRGSTQLWPPKKIRKIGRNAPYWKGQGGSRAKIPYDKKFGITGKYVNDSTEGLLLGGNKWMAQEAGDKKASSNPAVLKYYDFQTEEEHVELVPEMIAEFVVPDLTNFDLKPYVSYNVTDSVCVQPPHTPEQLFDEIYREKIEQRIESGKLPLDDKQAGGVSS